MSISTVESAKGRMGRRLREAIEHLRNDIDRVEFWAEIMDELEQPIPGYEAGESKLNQFSLGPDLGSEGSQRADDSAARGNNTRGENSAAKKRVFEGSFKR